MNRQLLRLLPQVAATSRLTAVRGAVGSKVVPQKDDKTFVEADAKKLCEYVCVNYFVEGEEPGPKILPDSEYPEWLFKLRLDAPRELEDLDPERDGWLYWRALHKRQCEQAKRLRELTIKKIHLQRNEKLLRPKLYHK
ncbi:hypothetical protein M3Y99_00696700 [Aphelenchoides fujianensis]|nr:hypothetical protein M3Y99_00696700 [Aphelenchoides fujianensis]